MREAYRTAVVVEDDPDARDFVTRALRCLGYEVWAAGDGELAIHLIGLYKPDLICLDLTLPNISGYDVCEAVKANVETRGARVLVVTGRLAPQDRALAEEIGVDAYLTKPFSLNLFSNVVERLMHRTEDLVSLQPKVQQ